MLSVKLKYLKRSDSLDMFFRIWEGPLPGNFVFQDVTLLGPVEPAMRR